LNIKIKQIEIMKAIILTVAEYNKIVENNMRFRTDNGSCRKLGYVVKNHQNAQYFKTESKAKEALLNWSPINNLNDEFRLATGND